MRPLVVLLMAATAGLALGAAPHPLLRRLNRAREFSVTDRIDPSCPFVPKPVALPNPLPAALETALGQLGSVLDSLVDPVACPGYAAALSYQGKVLKVYAGGVANKTSGVVPDPHATLFRIGSVTKTFAAVLLEELASQNLVDPDEPVRVRVPEFQPLNPYDNASISWRHLAQQRAGLQREMPANLNTTAQVLAALATQYLISAPGERPSYSNFGFGLLGNLLAERILNQTFDAAVAQYILNPAQLVNTGDNYTPAVLARLAVPYLADGSVAPFADLGWEAPAGNMYSTVVDLVALSDALMQAAFPQTPSSTGQPGGALGSLIHPAVGRQFLDPDYFNRDGFTMMGAPWEMRNMLNYTILRKGGNLPGFSTLFSFLPDLQLSLAVTWNGAMDEFSASDALWGALLPAFNATLTTLQPTPQFNPGPNFSPFLGVYADAASGSTAHVIFNATGDGSLLFVVPGFVGVYMDFFPYAPDIYRVGIPASAYDCLGAELEALGGQLILFGRNATGQVDRVSVPGFVPGITWTR